MISTQGAILLTQVPIAIGIFISVYLLYDVKRELIRVLEKLAERHNKKE